MQPYKSVLLGTACFLGMMSTAQAQEAGLADIVVTAQKRSESLISVPLAISAQTGEALAVRGVTQLEQLVQTTPGLNVNNATGQNQIYLRGIGNSLYASAAESSIALYVNGVPRPRATSAMELFNIERVEVLRGPQGALYGRNASGGAINILTKNPSGQLEAKGQFSFGEYDTVEASGYLNLPISDRVAMNFSATRRHHDPFMINLGPGPDEYNQNFWSVESKLKFELDDTFEVLISGDYSYKNDANGFGWQQQRYDITDAYYRGTLAAFGLPQPPPGFTLARTLGKREVTEDQDSGYRTKDRGVSLQVTKNFDFADLTLVSSYRKHHATGDVEIDATEVPIAGFTSDNKSKTMTHELRLASSGDGPLGWLVGASYFLDKNNENLYGLVLGMRNPAFDLNGLQRIESLAGFTQVSYDFSDQLSVVGSLRYTTERKHLVFPAQAANGFNEIEGRLKENRLIPSLTVNYDVADGQLVYARYAQGYKSGGMNSLLNPAALPPPNTGVVNRFKPEIVNTYELGYKARISNTARVTAALFYNDIKNIQVARTGGPGVTNFVLNAAKARTYGAELDVTWQVVPELTITAAGAYINSKYIDYSSAGIPTLGILPFNSNGNQMQNTPKWSGTVSVDYAQPISSDLTFILSGNVAYKSSFNFEAQADPQLKVDSYVLVNGRLGIRSADNGVGLYVFARNLLNKYYYQSGQSNAAGILLTPAAPRVLGGTLEFSF